MKNYKYIVLMVMIVLGIVVLTYIYFKDTPPYISIHHPSAKTIPLLIK